MGKGLACRGRCEEVVAHNIAWSDRIKRRSPYIEQVTTQARSNRFVGASFYLILGVLMSGFGVYRFSIEGLAEPVFFFGLMGMAFLAFGVVALWRTLRMIRPPE